MCVSNSTTDKILVNTFRIIKKGCYSTDKSKNQLFHFDSGLFFILNLTLTYPRKLPAVSQAATGRRCLSNNAIIIAIRAQTLGNREALLDPLAYFFFVGNEDWGVLYWILTAWHHMTPSPIILHHHGTKSTFRDVRGVHMYHMLEVEEAPKSRRPAPTPVLPEALLVDRVVSGTL